MPEIDGATRPEPPPPEPPSTESPPDLHQPEPTAPAAPAYLPFGAYAPPSVITAPRPAWARAYELPTARRVVSAGLLLAQSSSVAIRRASIYVGLLSLGAFGPAAILILAGLARLLSDPVTSEMLRNDPFALFTEQPDLAGPLTLVYVTGIVGFVLLLAISIDAQAIAISLLGSAAAGAPLTLSEALTRARQTFWRLVGSGLLVGLGSGLLSLALAWPFLRPLDTNQGVSFIASMIATLVFTPFAFAATGIVLGDTGVVDTLRRSMRLFRARPRIALVVTLFALVTAAIQSFALGGGADLVFRVADFFHIGEGASSLILPGILVLAFIVAFGSLTFTIAAVVAAPQVAAFLGLTFYSGGLDKARVSVEGPPRRVRWVSVPMTVVMVGLAVIVVAGIPMIASFHPRERSPMVALLRHDAQDRGQYVSSFGPPSIVEDLSNDVLGATGGALSSDIVLADVGWFGEVPDWLLDAFDCTKPGVLCGDGERLGRTYYDGALVFFERVAAGPDVLPAGRVGEWGPILAVGASLRASGYRGLQYPGASHAFITRRSAGHDELVLVHYTNSATFAQEPTSARSVWLGTDLVTLVPFAELGDEGISWDAYAADRAGSDVAQWTFDILRSDGTKPLLHLDVPTMFVTLPTSGP
jgi:hypothetical protein